jgi:hypothetical protein
MERKARQYDVLGDAALFVAYKTAHEQFVSMTLDLGRLPLDEKQQQDFQILIETEREVFQVLGGASGPEVGGEKSASQEDGEKKKDTSTSKLNTAAALAKFQSLTQFAVSIRKVSEWMVDQQAESMQQAAKTSKQRRRPGGRPRSPCRARRPRGCRRGRGRAGWRWAWWGRPRSSPCAPPSGSRGPPGVGRLA